MLQHAPSSSRETNKVSKPVKLDTIQRFSEYVGWHFIGATMIEDDSAIAVCLTDEVVPDRNVLCTRVKGGVLDELDSRFVVAVK